MGILVPNANMQCEKSDWIGSNAREAERPGPVNSQVHASLTAASPSPGKISHFLRVQMAILEFQMANYRCQIYVFVNHTWQNLQLFGA